MAAVNLSNHMWISCHRTNVLWQDTAEAVSRAAHVDLPPPSLHVLMHDLSACLKHVVYRHVCRV